MLAGQIPHLSSFGQRESAQNDASKYRPGGRRVPPAPADRKPRN